MRFTLDGASDFGVRLKDHNQNYLRYVSRYADGGNSYLNFLSLNFTHLIDEVIWLFPPKSQEGIFLRYYLQSLCRPHLVLLLLQHQSLPSIYNYAARYCDKQFTFPDSNFLSKAVKGKSARSPHPFQGLMHIFYFARVG